MLVSFDFEFIEDGRRIFPLSIGLVADDGRELYRQFSDAPFERANEWVRANVLPKLTGLNGNRIRKPWGTRAQIVEEIREFCKVAADRPTALQFLGYYCAYDWVAMAQLFGTMMQLPEGWPMFAYDLRQALDERGLQHITQPDDMPHQALSDAKWIMQTYEENVLGHSLYYRPAALSGLSARDGDGYALQITRSEPAAVNDLTFSPVQIIETKEGWRG